MKKRFLSCLRFIKKQGYLAFFKRQNQFRCFIYPLLNNSERKFNKIYVFQNCEVPSYLKDSHIENTFSPSNKTKACTKKYEYAHL